jgi:peptidoglycan hydrolase CwlO-like protein
MSSKKIYTNVSANPVVLSDGSSVQPGGQTTEEQFELAKGSLWEEHGLLVAGAPDQPADADADRQSLIDENDQLKKDVFAYQEQLKDFASQLKDGPQQVKDLQDKLTQEQARSSKLEGELKDAQAKLAAKK